MRDHLRVGATLLAALFQVVVPALGYVGRLGRMTGAEFQTAKTPLVPADYAFGIWGVIFAACFVYAAEQARPSRRQDPTLRRVGWPMAAAMAVNGVWSVFAQLEYPLLLLFGIFLVGFAASLVAVLRLFRSSHGGITWRVGPAVGLQAGWVSVAIFANLSVALADLGYGQTPGRAEQALILLCICGATACAVARSTRGSLAYGAAVGWALVALGVANLSREHQPLVAGAAGAWLVALAICSAVTRRG